MWLSGRKQFRLEKKKKKKRRRQLDQTKPTRSTQRELRDWLAVRREQVSVPYLFKRKRDTKRRRKQTNKKKNRHYTLVFFLSPLLFFFFFVVKSECVKLYYPVFYVTSLSLLPSYGAVRPQLWSIFTPALGQEPLCEAT